MIVPETVTVRLSNVKDLLNVVVWLVACAAGANPARASSANTRIGAFIFLVSKPRWISTVLNFSGEVLVAGGEEFPRAD